MFLYLKAPITITYFNRYCMKINIAKIPENIEIFFVNIAQHLKSFFSNMQHVYINIITKLNASLIGLMEDDVEHVISKSGLQVVDDTAC